MDSIKENFLNLSGKVVLVTGANGQIGLSLVNKLIEYKAKVVAVDLKINNLNKLKKKKNIKEKEILILKSDIKKLYEVKKIFLVAKKNFNCINSLVCNAGVAVFESYMDIYYLVATRVFLSLYLKHKIFLCYQQQLKFQHFFEISK